MRERNFNMNEPDFKKFYRKNKLYLTQCAQKGSLNIHQDIQMYNQTVEFNRDVGYICDTVELHNHEFYELIYVVSGDLDYLMESNRFPIGEGDLLLIPPGFNHRPIFPENMEIPYERYVLWMNAKFVEKIVENYSNVDYCFRYCKEQGNVYMISLDSKFRNLVLSMFHDGFQEQVSTKMCNLLMLDMIAMRILVFLNRYVSDEEDIVVNRAKKELIDEIIAYIDQHFCEELSVQQIAENFFLSESSVAHQFKKVMKVPIYKWIMQKRLMMAKHLLYAGGRPTEISVQCGFKDYSTFYRAFQKQFYLSPREYLNYRGEIEEKILRN